MLPDDDPRHGSHAGAIQHWRAGETPCEPCAIAARRLRKRNDLNKARGRGPTVPLGRAWDVINQTPLNQLAAATGIRTHRLIDYRNRGPEMLVHRATRERIVGAGTNWTVVGLQRRLQALTALGWSMLAVSQEGGLSLESVKKLRRAKRRSFVRRDVAEAIVETYDRLHMRIPPDGPSKSKTLADAKLKGWPPPLAWTNIDDPDEHPSGVGHQPRYRNDNRDTTECDPVVVDRILAGDWELPCTPAEKAEVGARWVAAGGSTYRLEQLTGWRLSRYYKKGAA